MKNLKTILTTDENLGMFKGKEIAHMNNDELIDFIRWAGNRIMSLEKRLEDLGSLDLGSLFRKQHANIKENKEGEGNKTEGLGGGGNKG